jgi:hypothetical protein
MSHRLARAPGRRGGDGRSSSILTSLVRSRPRNSTAPREALDGLAAGRDEVIADADTAGAKAALSADR